MKTTLDIPDPLFRQLKATAALKGQTMRTFFIEAVRARLKELQDTPGPGDDPPWLRFVGSVPPGMRDEIDQSVAAEFSSIDAEQWK